MNRTATAFVTAAASSSSDEERTSTAASSMNANRASYRCAKQQAIIPHPVEQEVAASVVISDSVDGDQIRLLWLMSLNSLSHEFCDNTHPFRSLSSDRLEQRAFCRASHCS